VPTAFTPARTDTLPAQLTFATIDGISIAHMPQRIAIGELDEVIARAMHVEYEQNFYDVVYHGTPDTIEAWVNGTQVAVEIETIYKALLHHLDFIDQPIRLVACEAGAGPDCVAQWLADRLNVEVLAATAKIASLGQRLYFVGRPGCWQLYYPSSWGAY
jgi:hypothetical protein